MFISTSMLLIPILIAIVLFVLIVVISNIKIGRASCRERV